jgi:hypothetical protein
MKAWEFYKSADLLALRGLETSDECSFSEWNFKSVSDTVEGWFKCAAFTVDQDQVTVINVVKLF